MPTPIEANPVGYLIERLSAALCGVVGEPAPGSEAEVLLESFLADLPEDLVSVEEAELVLAFDPDATIPDAASKWIVAVSCERDDAALHIDAETGGLWSRVLADEYLSLISFRVPRIPGTIAVVADSASLARQLVGQLAARGRGVAFVGVASPSEVELAHLVDMGARHAEVTAMLLAFSKPGDAETLELVLREAGANLPVVVWNVGGEMERSGDEELPVLWCEGPAEGACMAVALAELDPPVGFSVRVLGASSGLRLALRWLAGRRGIDTTMTVTAPNADAMRSALARLPVTELAVVVGSLPLLRAVVGDEAPTTQRPAMCLGLVDGADGRDVESMAWGVPLFHAADDVITALVGLTQWSERPEG